MKFDERENLNPLVGTYKVGLSTSEGKNKPPGSAVEKSESMFTKATFLDGEVLQENGQNS